MKQRQKGGEREEKELFQFISLSVLFTEESGTKPAYVRKTTFFEFLWLYKDQLSSLEAGVMWIPLSFLITIILTEWFVEEDKKRPVPIQHRLN